MPCGYRITAVTESRDPRHGLVNGWSPKAQSTCPVRRHSERAALALNARSYAIYLLRSRTAPGPTHSSVADS